MTVCLIKSSKEPKCREMTMIKEMECYLQDVIESDEDQQILIDTFNYRLHSIPELIKKLDILRNKVLRNKHSDDWIECFIKAVVICYLQCIESIKLSRAIYKLIQTWNQSHNTVIEKQFEDFLVSVIRTDNNKSQLVAVSSFLDNNDNGRCLMEKHHVTVLKWLDWNISRILSTKELSTQQTGELYMYVRIMIQLYKFSPLIFASPVFDKTDKDEVRYCRSLLNHLIQILQEERYPSDCQFLCGTAVNLILVKMGDLEEIRNVFWTIFKIIGKDIDFSMDILLTKDNQLENQTSKLMMGQIAILKGVLSHVILLQNEPFLKKYFLEIIELCKGPIMLHYHAFITLEHLFNKISTAVLIDTLPDLADILSSTLDIIWLNLDSPVQDVPQIVTTIFSTMLQIWQHNYKHSRCHDIIPNVLSRLHKIPWYVKGQYRILSALSPYVNVTQILTDDLRKQLLKCMSINSLATNGADVYKSFLFNLRKEECCVESWKDQWKETVIDGLIGDNRLQSSNVGHYWIPLTVKILPEVKDCLIVALTERMVSSTTPRQQLLYGWVTVAKVVRMNTGKFPLETELLREALYSSDDDIRTEAFCVLCTSLKKADRLRKEEEELIVETLPNNLKVGSAPFRQQLSANVKNLLLRIRDSFNSISKEEDLSTIERSFNFVSWFYKLCVDNISIGACFQRIKMCLDFMQITLETFFPTKTAMPSISIEAKKRGLWDMFTYESTMSVLHCILDGADEIQNLATKLLLEYFQWPLIPSDSCKSIEDLACSLLLSALELCDQPKQHENRSGVLICQVIFVKYIIEQNWFFSWCYDNGEYQAVSVTKGDNLCSKKFLVSVMNHIHQTFLKSQQDSVKASASTPIHGFVSALTICIAEMSSRLPSCNITDILHQFIDLNCNIVIFMMDIMSKESADNSCPSFAELGQAMENLITTSQTDYTGTSTLSSQHQFLLSWCWINIKECCHSLSCLCNVLLKQTDLAVQVTTAEKIKDIFLQVLTKCRHRGVIEGCRSSFVQFIGHLFSASERDINSIPRQIIEQLFHSFTSSTSSSITRRSAGMPIIIQAIVTVERKFKQTSLLQTCIEQLFRLLSEPLPQQYSDQHDLPQVHGLNILNTLFGDASLSAALMQYTSQAVVLVVNSFESPAWSIRNAATMLFGSLVMRIFGQKKNCAEEAWRGINLMEFSSLYPELPPLMNQCLDRALEVDMKQIDRIKTSLFPVLTLLSNLAPCDRLDDQVCTGLGHKVLQFLSSPVLYLRNLSASAYVALIPLQSLTKTIQSLGRQLSTATTNQQHGILCCLQKISLQELEQQQISTIQEQLIQNRYLRSSLCGIVRAKYLQLMKTLCWRSPEQMQNLTDIINLKKQKFTKVSLFQIGESCVHEEEIQILQRNCILNGLNVHHVVKEYLHMSDIQSSVDCIDCLKNNIHYFNREDLKHIQMYLSKLLSDGGIQYPSLLSSVSQVIVDIHYKIGSDKDVVSYLYQYWTREITHADNNTMTALDMVIGSICVANCIQVKSIIKEEMDRWSKEVYCSSWTVGAEHFKVAGGNCLKIAGPQVISVATVNEKFHPAAFLLIKAALTLIEDDDCDIRNLVIHFIASLEWKTKSLQYKSLQFSTGCLMLYDLVVCNFWNSHHVIGSLYKMLYTPGEIQKIFIQRIQNRRQHLFEKQDNNFFSEKIFTCRNVYKTLMTIMKKHTDSKPVFTNLDKGNLVIKDLEFFISEVIRQIKGQRLINKLTDGIVLGVITGLILASYFMMTVNSTGKENQYWKNIQFEIEKVLKRRNCNLSTDGIPFAQGDLVICIMNWSIQFTQKEFLNNRIVRMMFYHPPLEVQCIHGSQPVLNCY